MTLWQLHAEGGGGRHSERQFMLFDALEKRSSASVTRGVKNDINFSILLMLLNETYMIMEKAHLQWVASWLVQVTVQGHSIY